MIKLKKAIAWYKTCLIRTNGYINIYNAVAITMMLFKNYNISFKYLPIGVIGILLFILIWGSIDIISGIYEAENRLGHEKSPILMEIHKGVEEIKGKVSHENP